LVGYRILELPTTTSDTFYIREPPAGPNVTFHRFVSIAIYLEYFIL